MIFNNSGPRVAILLCTYNGDKFIEEQLISFSKQTHKNLKVWVSDDNSTDKTLEILQRYQKDWGKDRLFITKGPQKGCVENFMNITCNENISADFYAYADQDDIWKSNKITRSIENLESFTETPALYGTRTELINAYGESIGLSPLFTKAPSLKNALLQSIAGGNTMVFNNKAMKLLREAGELKVVSHDWWAYILISGVGGVIIYDPIPSLLYRQHDANVIGENRSLKAKLQRAALIFNGRYRKWNNINIKAISKVQNLFSIDSWKTVEEFNEIRNSSFFNRLIMLWRSGIHRQSLIDNIGLLVASICKKL
jgi:glycosyltransferase involved in cell wall biosynthesis